ncbi:hypothetical protein [Streptomyces daliensis]|uniref:Uncharacterized protein n=1 Tax=Streptomyces daliensis TaxID=299421 RepID=A0A8T4IZ24_9ACTN|nr:hypothetical protein [Streptomyces daliensis]
MEPLFDRVEREETAVRGELAELQMKTAAAEERLKRLRITRETLASLLDESADAPEEPSSVQTADEERLVEDESPDASTAGHEQELDREPVGLEEGRQRALAVLATSGRAMKARDVAVAIGEDVSEGRRVETTRTRLKKLVTEGYVIEEPASWFAIAPTALKVNGTAVAHAEGGGQQN